MPEVLIHRWQRQLPQKSVNDVMVVTQDESKKVRNVPASKLMVFADCSEIGLAGGTDGTIASASSDNSNRRLQPHLKDFPFIKGQTFPRPKPLL